MASEKETIVAEKTISIADEASQESLACTGSKQETIEAASLRKVEEIALNRSALRLVAILCALYVSKPWLTPPFWI